MDAKTIVFWIAVVCTVAAGILGIVGIWVQDFWRNDIGWRLFMTDVVVAATSIVACAILSWLR